MSGRWHVRLVGWQKVAWALDEDLRWVRWALDGRSVWASLPGARIVHAAWPAGVNAISQAALRGKVVVCQADNPPAFYLNTEGFAEAASRVDLWIARTREATAQFRCLGLPVAQVPYCVDARIFRPLPNRAEIRGTLGLAAGDFVIGNFHRDSEGSDLTRPKKQKGPDIFLEIAKELNKRISNMTVLLAGPRRHWLLHALRAEGIRVVFAGTEPHETDDYKINILTRERLNELYQALDVCVISSRWEGGPYAVLEALAAGRDVISTPVGTSRDVLPEECCFTNVGEAVELLERQAKSRVLTPLCLEASSRAAQTHSSEALKAAMLSAYESLPCGGVSIGAAALSVWHLAMGRMFLRGRVGMPRLVEARREILERARCTDDKVGVLNYCEDGKMETLMECAAKIAAARGI